VKGVLLMPFLYKEKKWGNQKKSIASFRSVIQGQDLKALTTYNFYDYCD